MASEPNDLDQYVAYVRAELNKGKYTAFEFMSRERLREILDALTEARAALAVQARTHVVGLTYEAAEKLALRAIHDTDGRGMVGRGRNHLHQRVARAIMAASTEDRHD